MNKKNKIISSTILGSLALCGGIGLVSYFVATYESYSTRKVKEYSSSINYFNDPNIKVNDSFVKGADVSSYADVIENLLFQNNIKKSGAFRLMGKKLQVLSPSLI